MKGHWTDDDFIARLYAGGPAERHEHEKHLDECPACRDRWRTFVARRDEIRSEADVPPEFLAAQRRSIYARMERPTVSAYRRAIPALAAAAMLAVGVWLLPHGSPVAPHVAAPDTAALVENGDSDARFFDEVAALDQSSEPAAARPIEALFEN